MSDATSDRRPPITDSPWFWVYLYTAVGLILLSLLQPKFGDRQAELERQYQGRQRAAEKRLGETPSKVPLSAPEKTIITLRPLYLTLAAACLIGWAILWRRHFRRPLPKSTNSSNGAAT